MKKFCITLPDGFELNLEESTKKNVVVEKITYPRSWEEYCRMYNGEGYWVVGDSSIVNGTFISPAQTDFMRKVLPTRLLATQFLAMMQLMSLRQAWIGDWEPDWKTCGINLENFIPCIIFDRNATIVHSCGISHPLSFPDYKIAEEFLACFRDLLEIAKPLI